MGFIGFRVLGLEGLGFERFIGCRVLGLEGLGFIGLRVLGLQGLGFIGWGFDLCGWRKCCTSL